MVGGGRALRARLALAADKAPRFIRTNLRPARPSPSDRDLELLKDLLRRGYG
jgi:hypothetical protein